MTLSPPSLVGAAGGPHGAAAGGAGGDPRSAQAGGACPLPADGCDFSTGFDGKTEGINFGKLGLLNHEYWGKSE